MKRLAIMGASGHGKVVADTAEAAGWESVEFFDDTWPKLVHNGQWQVVGNTSILLNDIHNYDGVLVAIGNNTIRLEKLKQLHNHGAVLVSVIHPSATVSRYATLGAGCVVMAGAVVNADTTIDMGCILNTGSSVDHDCVLGEGVHISPGARLAGGVTVGACTWIGIGASVRHLICIGSAVVVGAGAVVVKDIPDDCTAVGVPARISRSPI